MYIFSDRLFIFFIVCEDHLACYVARFSDCQRLVSRPICQLLTMHQFSLLSLFSSSAVSISVLNSGRDLATVVYHTHVQYTRNESGRQVDPSTGSQVGHY